MRKIDKENLLVEDLIKNQKGKRIDLRIPAQLQNKCIGYSGIFTDLTTCEEALNELINTDIENIVGRSLFTTIITIYGKCFTDSSSTKSPKLEKSVFRENIRYLKLHDEIMDLRHNFIAHRGKTDNAFAQAFLQIDLENMLGNIKVGHFDTLNFPREKIFEYLELIEYLKLEVRKKFSSNKSKVIKHILTELTDEEFKSLIITH